MELRRGRKEENENQMHMMEMSAKVKRLVYMIYEIMCSEQGGLEIITFIV